MATTLTVISHRGNSNKGRFKYGRGTAGVVFDSARSGG